MKTCKVITNVSASCRVFTVQFVSIRFIYDLRLRFQSIEVLWILSLGIYQRDFLIWEFHLIINRVFRQFLSQFPVSYPEIKFTIFSNRADYILLPSFTNGRRNVRTKLRQKNRGRLIWLSSRQTSLHLSFTSIFLFIAYTRFGNRR